MKKIWLERYPPGVPHEIDPDRYPSLAALIDQRIAKFADLPAFSSFGVALTYMEFDALASALSAFLHGRLGMQPGDRIALMMPNLLQYPVAMLAALRAGLVIVNVNPLYTPRELEYQLNDAGAVAIVVWAEVTPALAAVAGAIGIRHTIVAQTGDLLGAERPVVPVADGLRGVVGFRDALALGRTLESPGTAIEGDDLAFLQYTGGTTGRSKGAVLTHRNLVANVLQTCAMFGSRSRDGEEIYITALPLYHVFALTANCLACIYRGGCNVLIANPRDLPGLVRELRNWRFTYISGVNTLLNGLLNTPGFNELDFSALRITVTGGMALQSQTATRWREVTGCDVYQGYGLSETSPVLTLSPGDLPPRPGSIGLPAPSTEISIRDEAGRELPVGEPGELCARGPQVMRGYWQKPEATREAMTADGFFRTGDIAIMDEDGFFHIVDRKKDMIVVSGFKVFPNEVEDVVTSMQGVLECACVGVPDSATGEAVWVFVVPKPGTSVAEAELLAWCKRRLAAYKLPSRVEFLETLPKTNVGKIIRRELRELALARRAAAPAS
jgi:long-chain acyl-CoA synthetase